MKVTFDDGNLHGFKGWQATVKPYNQALRATATAASAAIQSPEPLLKTTKAGEQIKAAASVRSTNEGGLMRIAIREKDPTGKVVKESTSTGVKGKAWKTTGVTHPCVAAGNTLDIRIRYTGNASDVVDMNDITWSEPAVDVPPPTPTPDPTPDPTPTPEPPPPTGEIPGGLLANPWKAAKYRQPVPAGEPNHAESAAWVKACMALRPGMNEDDAPTRFLGKQGDPVRTFAGQKMYTPANASPSTGGADHTMEIFNEVTPDGKVRVGARDYEDTYYGGHYQGAAYLDGDGYPTIGGNGTAWGLMSSCAILLGEEMAAGKIPHAIGVALNKHVLSGSKYMAPARRSESKADGFVAMGARLQCIKPWAEVETILRSIYTGSTLAKALTVWKALCTYGFIFRDGTDGSFAVYGDPLHKDGSTLNTIMRTPGLWGTASNWRVPARSAY